MLPDIGTILIVVLLGIATSLAPVFLPKKIGTWAEIIIAVAVVVYLFWSFSFVQASLLLAFGASAYGTFGQLVDPEKKEKRKQLQRTLRETDSVEIVLAKETKRIAADWFLTLLVCLGAGLFFALAPANYAVMKLFVGMMFLSVSAQMAGRMGNFYSTRLFWLPEKERLVIVSLFQSRDFPIRDLKEMRKESAPDLLKLHPLFTFLSSNQDYTSSFSRVLRLSFPGENIYFTPKDTEYWEAVFASYAVPGTSKPTKGVLPFWHPRVLKRLFWKGYLAAAVKGISAYTGLLFLLIWLDVPSWVIVVFVLFWWGLNVYVSDRVLVAATDAEPLTEGEVYERAQILFEKAGIPRTRLFVVDSPIFNGLATGMNIGRAAVMLTTATLRLPINSVEAILAHEAIHIKKRDVLLNQWVRFIFLAVLGGITYPFYEDLRWLAQNAPFVVYVSVYLLMMVFPMVISFFAQWAEVRADHLGASLLSGGNEQMANGLTDLALAQERDLEKSWEYRLANEHSALRTTHVERDSWFWRFFEFQFQAHPPMYWRIQTLRQSMKWKEARRRWMMDRFKESMPDFFQKKK